MNRLMKMFSPIVREHHAPVGALRLGCGAEKEDKRSRQGAPRTCRCIETILGGLFKLAAIQSGSTTHL